MQFSKIGSHQDVAGFRYPATAICCLLVCILHTIYGVKVMSIPEKKQPDEKDDGFAKKSLQHYLSLLSTFVPLPLNKLRVFTTSQVSG